MSITTKSSHYFQDRADAATQLAAKLNQWHGKAGVVVLGVPLPGIAVAYHLAKALELPIDVVLTVRIAAPGNNTITLGAVAEGDIEERNADLIGMYSVTPDEVGVQSARAQKELTELQASLRRACPAHDLHSKTVIITDEGLVTGFSMLAAIEAAKKRGASNVVVAVPMATAEAVEVLGDEVTVVALYTPDGTEALDRYFATDLPVNIAEAQKLLGGH